MNFNRNEIKRYDWAYGYIMSELKIGRHILACLGSAGICFNSEIERFKEWLAQPRYMDEYRNKEKLIEVINEMEEIDFNKIFDYVLLGAEC